MKLSFQQCPKDISSPSEPQVELRFSQVAPGHICVRMWDPANNRWHSQSTLGAFVVRNGKLSFKSIVGPNSELVNWDPHQAILETLR